jgi:acyl-CoA thioester hydrolase
MKELKDFKFKKELQLRWNDMDALGHVNNAIFITYFETARGHYMLEACPGWDWHKHMFLIANVNVDFRKELLLNAQKPTVWMRTSRMGKKSFVLEYVITSEKKGEQIIHASGTTTQIMFDMRQRKTVEIEAWTKESLTTYEEATIAE